MVIPRGVRKIVVHFLVYDPVLKEPKSYPLSSSTPASKNGKEVPNPNKLRKKASRVLHPQEKIRDFPTKRRSTRSFAHADVEAQKTSGNLRRNREQNLDGMEIEVVGKKHRAEMEVEREEDREGEYVVMRRVVKLPRRVWCGRNCKDKFEQLFIRRT
ncbi:hypothetical protein EAE96_010715 [Botrytis aclada]|nr:hypothetical protein EAE96_010715 [Botrytis aclada]